MSKVRQLRQQLLRWKRLPLAAIALALAVLGGAILLTTLSLRETIRDQIVNHDGEVLQGVSWLQQNDDEANGELLAGMDDPAEQFQHIMKISRMKGVLGVRLFSAEGAFMNAFPAYITEAALPAADLAKLKALRPVGHFQPRASLASVDLSVDLGEGLEAAAKPVPLLEVNVPLQAKGQGRLLGVAQFIVQGNSIAQEYAALDLHLARRAWEEFMVAAGLLTTVLLLGFRKIHRANRLLAEQAGRLLHANQELALAAKTSAVGAVASHLIHGLKNPLSGLQGFVRNHVSGQATETDADWRDAAATTQRMQTLIGGVVRILEDQQAVGSYEISLRELVEIISARMLPIARAAGIQFYAQLRAEGILGNREANLTILVLENLIQNAFQATPEGKSVRLALSQDGEKIRCEVQDEGPGFPAALQAKIFSPCRSTKPEGSGIGLAISRQLALNIGAELELKSSAPSGCVFCLALPQKLTLPALISTEHLRG